MLEFELEVIGLSFKFLEWLWISNFVFFKFSGVNSVGFSCDENFKKLIYKNVYFKL